MSSMQDLSSRALNPEEEVKELLNQAQQVTTLPPTLEWILKEYKALFLDVFNRQLNLIRSRSQALEHAHVTVYDKVLLALTSNGTDLLKPAAVNWYFAEYFGYDLNVAEEHNMHAIKQSLGLTVALNKGPQVDVSPESPHQSLSPRQVASPLATSPADRHGRTILRSDSVSSIKNNKHLQTMWSVYQKDLAAFKLVAEDGTEEALEKARDLRDTAENGIHLLQTYDCPDQDLLQELRSNHEIAKRVVEGLHGGKKRKFDRNAEDFVANFANRHNKSRGGNDNFGRSEAYSRAHAKEYGRMDRSESPSKDENVAPYRERDRIHTGQWRSHHQPYSHHYRGADSGRGHSGVPHGYSRARLVDSYVPTYRERSEEQEHEHEYIGCEDQDRGRHRYRNHKYDSEREREREGDRHRRRS